MERRVRPGLCLSPEPGFFFENVFRLRGNLCFMILKNHKIMDNFFLTVHGLRYCVRAFSSCGAQGLLCRQCLGFSLRWPPFLWSTGSRARACGLQ